MNFGWQNVPQGLHQHYLHQTHAQPNRVIGNSYQYTHGYPGQVTPCGHRPAYAMNYYGPVPRNFIKLSPSAMTGNFNSGMPLHPFIRGNAHAPRMITNYVVYYKTLVAIPTQPMIPIQLIRPVQKMSVSRMYTPVQKGVIQLQKQEVPQFCCPHGITKCLLLEDPCFVPPRQPSGPKSPEKRPGNEGDRIGLQLGKGTNNLFKKNFSKKLLRPNRNS